MLINELEINPKKLIKLVHYDGTPISARFISDGIAGSIVGRSNARPQEAAQ
jgi:2-oxoglutarate ferredoxin oxidoreductase subunit alpha